MPITSTPTPNPNALKVSVGVPIGGPGTVVRGGTSDEAFAGELVALDGVRGQPVEHEGVVRVGAVSDSDDPRLYAHVNLPEKGRDYSHPWPVLPGSTVRFRMPGS